ncbi:unnamed protein product [Penicillium roqueforti FM164]|uniref:Genomic scaffold, ProqFM164S02 n=1 Tax=Penicillium roqueforti (strain FM164) TaxID=1365484 RepID=W6QLV5_PENRF|nr:unnamed protein product [Penicillium roqueforti FM164]
MGDGASKEFFSARNSQDRRHATQPGSVWDSPMLLTAE